MGYKIKYTMDIERGDFEKLEGKAGNVGMCDAFLFVSIVKQGGGFSTLIAGRDGTLPPGMDDVHDTEIFKVWAMLAAGLMKSHKLFDWQKKIMAEAHESVRKVITGPIPPELMNQGDIN